MRAKRRNRRRFRRQDAVPLPSTEVSEKHAYPSMEKRSRDSRTLDRKALVSREESFFRSVCSTSSGDRALMAAKA